jgi:hypothetical protein
MTNQFRRQTRKGLIRPLAEPGINAVYTLFRREGPTEKAGRWKNVVFPPPDPEARRLWYAPDLFGSVIFSGLRGLGPGKNRFPYYVIFGFFSVAARPRDFFLRKGVDHAR